MGAGIAGASTTDVVDAKGDAVGVAGVIMSSSRPGPLGVVVEKRRLPGLRFNLPDYYVVQVTRGDDGDRQVVIATTAMEAACPDCGVFSTRVHQRTRQRLKDVAFDGHVSVEWVKKRWRCAEPLCGRATFTEHTEQVPPRARSVAQ